jgi:predicted transglutaminase-like cysteine proteinase
MQARCAENQTGVQKGISRLAVFVVLAANLLAACATTSSQTDVRLSVAEHVPPPGGAFEFCVSNRDACGLDAVETDEVHHEVQTVSGAKMVRDAESPTEGAGMAEADTDDATSSAAGTGQWLTMAAIVNEQINRAIGYRSDRAIWGRDEAWLLPLSQEGVAYGDCEDYALEKRAALISAGVPADRLAMATAWSRSTGEHAVLVLRADDADYVLDNTTSAILRVDQTSYSWRSLQTGDLLTWSRVVGGIGI